MGLINFIAVEKAFNNQEVLKGVSFTVERGERVALIGPNGAGKTTLLRIAQGLETADRGSAFIARGITAGMLTQDLSDLQGDDSAVQWRELSVIEEKRAVVEQQMALPGADLPALFKAYDKLTARFEALDGYSAEARLKKTLLGLGLRQEALFTPLNRLSSGEKMRAALARILLKEPELLVLDEPTNHLDIGAMTWLEEYLRRFAGGVLLISHDRYFLDRVATRVIELAGGTIIEHRGSYTSFAAQKALRVEHARIEEQRLAHDIRRRKELIQDMRHMRRFSNMHMYEKQLEKLKTQNAGLKDGKAAGHLSDGRAARIALGANVHVSAEIARADNAAKRFGGRTLFSGVSFLIRGGEKVGIVGDNGCGKTTLLRMLLGLDADFTGACRIGSWVKYVFLDQNAAFADEERTLTDEVRAAREMTDREARDALARVGLYGEEADKRIGVLSGGERVRLKLCCAVAQEPHCLVLDEPTNHLDLPAREAIENALADFKGSVIAVSHDRYFLRSCVDRLLVFQNGGVIAYDGGFDVYAASLAETAARRDAPRPRPQQKTNAAAPAADDDTLAVLESSIADLEAAKAALEANFSETTVPEIYHEYARIDRDLATLYARWEALAK